MSLRWPLIIAVTFSAFTVCLYMTIPVGATLMLATDLGQPVAVTRLLFYISALTLVGAFIPAPTRAGVLLPVTAVAGLATFALMAAVCAFAPSFAILLIGRFLQAITGAAVLWAAAGLVRAAHPGPDDVWRAIPLPVAGLLVGLVAGLPLGGTLADYLGWRWIFLGFVPLVVLALVLVAVFAARRR